MADLTKLSTGDLMALRAGDLSKVSDAGLMVLRGSGAPPAAPKRPIEKPPFEQEAERLVNTTGAELIAGASPTRFAMSAASPLMAALQIGANIMGGDAARDVNAWIANLEGMKRRGMEAYGRNYDIAGTVGAVANPVGLATTGALPAATTLGGRVAQGAAVGAGYGAATPVVDAEDGFWAEKGAQAGVGAAVGGAVPLVASAVKNTVLPVVRGAYHAVEPHLPGGTERVMARTLNQAAGDRQPQVVAALQSPTELVPGSRPTAGEAAAPAGSAEFSALQRVVEDVRPSEYVARGAEQEGARRAAIQSVGQDAATLATARGSRAATAGANYRLAFREAVRADPELARIASNPYFQQALPDAVKLAEANGVSPKADLTEFLHFVKLSLDKQVGKTGDTALSNTERQTVETLKNSLVDWMGRKNPQYDVARQTFAADSRPINQMEVGQYLERALVEPLAGRERARSLANAVRNAPQTLKRSTGFSRYENLADVLDPPQVAAVDGVLADVARKADYEDLARAGMPAIQKQLGIQSREARLPQMLERTTMIANAILSRLQGRASEKTLNDLAIRMQDPAQIAQLMQSFPPGVRRAITNDVANMVRNQGAIGLPAVVSAEQQ